MLCHVCANVPATDGAVDVREMTLDLDHSKGVDATGGVTTR